MTFDILEQESDDSCSHCSSEQEFSGNSNACTGVPSPRFRHSRPYVVCIEGNIGSGKSTMMRYFKACENVKLVPEPIDKWTNIKGHNALAKLYEDGERWGFSFNTYAALTRLQMHLTITDKPVMLLERSLYSMRYCFVENKYRTGKLHGLEYSILDRWFEHFLHQQQVPIDLFVYLRADPAKCYERLRLRDRQEELTVPFSFIEELHSVHESWLMDKKLPLPAPVLVLDANLSIPRMESLYDEHRARILFESDVHL